MVTPLSFEILAKSSSLPSRTGRVTTRHGSFDTPAFMPVGTQGTIKGLLPDQVAATGAQFAFAPGARVRHVHAHSLAAYLYKKTPKDFIPDGTTQHQFTINVVKNLRRDIQLNAWLQYERWKAPIYKVGQQNDVVVAGQIKFYPKLHTDPQPAK